MSKTKNIYSTIRSAINTITLMFKIRDLKKLQLSLNLAFNIKLEYYLN